MELENILEYPSVNFNERPDGCSISHLVIHSIGLETFKESIDLLCDPVASVSAHYVIDIDGTIYRLVPDHLRAWHAGVSYWDGIENLNHTSIGIEIYNKYGETFPEIQMDSVIGLCKHLIDKYNIEDYNILAHSDIATDRKVDPGEFFDWKLMADNNIGYFPTIECEQNYVIAKSGDNSELVRSIKGALNEFGYKLTVDDNYCSQTENVVMAFKRRYNQDNMYPEFDYKSQLILDDLLLRFKA